MKKIIFFLLIYTSFLFPRDLIVITNINFPKDHLTQREIKAIFLDQKRFIKNYMLLPINYSFDDPLRLYFEKNILKKSRRVLERYWLKAHYNGKRPPKVVKSRAMLFGYLEKVPTAIGYIDNSTTLPKKIKILLKMENCR
jgi:ABC-type phosphate transport system substrate-binding protein